jgi:hypothetical protein
MTLDIDRDRSAVGCTPPRVVSIVGGAGFVTLGVWGMVDPQSFGGPTEVHPLDALIVLKGQGRPVFRIFQDL